MLKLFHISGRDACGWIEANYSLGCEDSPRQPPYAVTLFSSIFKTFLWVGCLCTMGIINIPRLDLPMGKPCLFSDRLSLYKISFIINLHDSKVPEMHERVNWLSAFSFYLLHTSGFHS